jgi:hypothetical protein
MLASAGKDVAEQWHQRPCAGKRRIFVGRRIHRAASGDENHHGQHDNGAAPIFFANESEDHWPLRWTDCDDVDFYQSAMPSSGQHYLQ